MTPEDISRRLGPDHVAWILQRPDPAKACEYRAELYPRRYRAAYLALKAQIESGLTEMP